MKKRVEAIEYIIIEPCCGEVFVFNTKEEAAIACEELAISQDYIQEVRYQKGTNKSFSF